MTALTPRQTVVLVYLRDQGQWVGIDQLATFLRLPRQGAARTLASLVRRGLAERATAPHVRVHYRATSAG